LVSCTKVKVKYFLCQLIKEQLCFQNRSFNLLNDWGNAFLPRQSFLKSFQKDFSLFVPWGSRSRGGSASVHRTQVVVVIRRRAENEATPPINGNMDR
jgi:hypothetical protein